MTSEIVRQGRAAWERLKKGNGDWADWILVGAALLEGRKIAMRNARTDRPSGTGYVQALHALGSSPIGWTCGPWSAPICSR